MLLQQHRCCFLNSGVRALVIFPFSNFFMCSSLGSDEKLRLSEFIGMRAAFLDKTPDSEEVETRAKKLSVSQSNK